MIKKKDSKIDADPQITYYVDSVNGDDNYPGTFSQPFKTLKKARDVVRTINSSMTGNIYILIRGGTYTLSSTLVLDYRDSGTNGYRVIYKAYDKETPVISGGLKISGWMLHDSQKNIWKVSAENLETRQVYVNGTRAVRARTVSGEALYNSLGITKKEDNSGYITIDSKMQNWGNTSNIEFQAKNDWKDFRCGVSDISGNNIIMKEPCWSNTQRPHLNWLMGVPDVIENAYELLDEEGEWYLDRSTGTMYYKPYSDENMSTVEVIAAKLETLIKGEGTADDPIRNITFEGITFSHATWLEPNGNNGFADIQSNFRLGPGTTDDNFYECYLWEKTPENVTFRYANNITFERNVFCKLGAVGLGLGRGSRNNVISGNIFTDISATGMQLGEITLLDCAPSNDSVLVKDNVISNNYIHHIAVEYRSGMAIWAGYVDNTTISHNEIHDVPSGGILVGWGWGGTSWWEIPLLAIADEKLPYVGYDKPSPCKDNKIIYNHTYNTMLVLRDSGAIYTYGAQPGLIIVGNHISNHLADFGAIYLDDGTRYATIQDNLLYANYMNKNFLVKGFDHDIRFNYYDLDISNWDYVSNSDINNNYIIGEDKDVPQWIIENAGLEQKYTDLLPEFSVNLAIGKPVKAYKSDGTIEIDLLATFSIDKVKIYFGSTVYPTEYDILYSIDGTNFSIAKSCTSGTGGVWIKKTFTAVNARYVRIAAVKPDGSSQTGGQMKIMELEIFGEKTTAPVTPPPLPEKIVPSYNLALNQPTNAFKDDLSIAAMLTGHEKEKAVDGDTANGAEATGNDAYKWTQEVDLGKVQNISRINIMFDSSKYATEYDIKTSLDGTTFTTQRVCTGGTGGVWIEHIFDPAAARYIRITAVKPDGTDQTGGRMRIMGLEAFEHKNLAYKKTAIGLWHDGTTAAMQSGYEASKAVDGIVRDTNRAQADAAIDYKWMLQVDLGGMFEDVNNFLVHFGSKTYSTNYEIWTSVDNISWHKQYTHVLDVGDESYMANITLATPVLARYVLLKAIKPDAYGQNGVQMGISEFCVYKKVPALR